MSEGYLPLLKLSRPEKVAALEGGGEGSRHTALHSHSLYRPRGQGQGAAGGLYFEASLHVLGCV